MTPAALHLAADTIALIGHVAATLSLLMLLAAVALVGIGHAQKDRTND